MKMLNKFRKIIGKSKSVFKSDEYWEDRYAQGGNSGEGSYNELANFKAQLINEFVEANGIKLVIEFGCGDGNQLSLAKYPRYIGLDVSRTAIHLCKKKFLSDKTKSFFIYDSTSFVDNNKIFYADLSLSLDVIYHLVEDDIFDHYMNHLFNSSSKFIIIYSNNQDGDVHGHEKNRAFLKWITINKPEWRVDKKVENPHKEKTTADFYILSRTQ